MIPDKIRTRYASCPEDDPRVGVLLADDPGHSVRIKNVNIHTSRHLPDHHPQEQPMHIRPRTAARATALATVLTLALALPAGALAVPASAASSTSGPTTGKDTAPDAKALRAALAGLPDGDATAALVRVGGTGGVWRGSAGVHDLATGRPADPNARFRVGSTTKAVTAAVVLQLAAEGEVDLGRPARHYLPDLIPSTYAHVTVRQLLNHTSGIPAAAGTGTTFEEWYAHRFDRHSPRAMVASATAEQPEFMPGTRQHYLNINYTVLGLLIERITGHSYEHETARRIFAPLRMRNTYFPGTDPDIRGPHNHGYQAVPRADGTTEYRDVTVWGTTDSWAAGAMISTTADLERFLTALFRGRVVPEPQLEEMFTVPADISDATMSAGLERYVTDDGTELWLKSGGRWGYNALIAATRDLSRTLVYSVNSTDAKGQGMNPVAARVVRAAFTP
ncbi:serine hydrolase domain-containing protein [Streptomyces turgidiscabies]|uniref:Beta-lactamase n=2 Tax=Streptomyces TaxID=1883 RepID=L7FE08_STRT8|nr:beta-lactamase [Streptomyces turgidiscabies Car8]GAQ76256.1 D-alanyl-D-alanine carboxypeptidase precursor [Streptomyces turgidiscabies]